MPLAADVVPEASEAAAVANLEQSIRVLQNGHLDTGLTGTYFMTKLLSEIGRNDLVFTYANQTTKPGYGCCRRRRTHPTHPRHPARVSRHRRVPASADAPWHVCP